MNVLVSLLVKYLESNPAAVEQLIAALVQALLQHVGAAPKAS